MALRIGQKNMAGVRGIGTKLYSGLKSFLSHGGAGVKNASSAYLDARSKVPVPAVNPTMKAMDVGAGVGYVGGSVAESIGKAM